MNTSIPKVIETMQTELVNKGAISQNCLDAIFSELKHQNKAWNEETTESGGHHSEIEFSVFIQRYVNHAVETISTNPEPTASRSVSEDLRKIAAMVVNCYIQKGDKEQLDYLIRVFENNYARLPVSEVLGAVQHCLNEINASIFRSSKGSVGIFLPAIFALCCLSMDESALCIPRV